MGSALRYIFDLDVLALGGRGRIVLDQWQQEFVEFRGSDAAFAWETR